MVNRRVNSAHAELKTICTNTDDVLWAAFERSSRGDGTGCDNGKLLFPSYRDGSLRVSEQEARFAFAEGLRSATLSYSVEAPTSKRYQFSGQRQQSAQSDLAVHDASGTRICNVEFKAKGLSPSASNHFPIYKDLQKLLREPQWGLWFHVLESVNNSTINNLLKVMATEINKVRLQFSSDLD